MKSIDDSIQSLHKKYQIAFSCAKMTRKQVIIKIFKWRHHIFLIFVTSQKLRNKALYHKKMQRLLLMRSTQLCSFEGNIQIEKWMKQTVGHRSMLIYSRQVFKIKF